MCLLFSALRNAKRGITLIEILVVVAVIAILAVIIFRVSGPLIQTATKAGCMSNMRSLHVSFETYLQDNGYWPQVPEKVSQSAPSEVEDYWLRTMDAYTGTRKVWLCPLLARARVTSSTGEMLKMHYVPTRFDFNKSSPHRWPTQPWLIEMGNVHGHGALILFPDGSIFAMDDILKKGKK